MTREIKPLQVLQNYHHEVKIIKDLKPKKITFKIINHFRYNRNDDDG